MKNFYLAFAALISFWMLFGVVTPMRAAADECFCYTNLTKIKPGDIKKTSDWDNVSRTCQQITTSCDDAKAYVKASFPSVLYLECESLKYEDAVCQKKIDDWTLQKTKLIQSQQNLAQATGFFGAAIPKCLLQDEFSKECRDVSLFVFLLINWGRSSLGIIGAFALAFFIYGGFILIMSQGNQESIKKGADTMLAALIGIAIVFAAYLLIRFLGEAVGIKSQFKLL